MGSPELWYLLLVLKICFLKQRPKYDQNSNKKKSVNRPWSSKEDHIVDTAKGK